MNIAHQLFSINTELGNVQNKWQLKAFQSKEEEKVQTYVRATE